MIIKLLLTTCLLLIGSYLLITSSILKPSSSPTEQISEISPPGNEVEKETDEAFSTTTTTTTTTTVQQKEEGSEIFEAREACENAFAVASQAFNQLRYEDISPCLADQVVFVLSETSFMPTLTSEAVIEELISRVEGVSQWIVDQNNLSVSRLKNIDPELKDSIIFLADDESAIALDINNQGKIYTIKYITNYVSWLNP